MSTRKQRERRMEFMRKVQAAREAELEKTKKKPRKKKAKDKE